MKKQLRAQVRQTLDSIGAAEVRRRSVAAAALLLQQPEYKSCEIVMVYLSMDLEVDTNDIVLRAWRDLKRVVAPLVRWQGHQMIPIEINSLEGVIIEGPVGLRQPSEGMPIPVGLIDLILVPGLAFDDTGGRLGRGRGFYDRFLSQPACRAVTCGLALEEQVLETIPRGEHDVGIDMLVTDKQVRRFNKSATQQA